MKVLVTGANGYLGRGIVECLLGAGVEVVAAGHFLSNVDNRAEKRECNIFAVENPYTFFGKPDVLLHMAWRDGFKHGSDAHIADLPKHYDFIKTMLANGMRKACVMGSMHEVGLFEGCVNENTPCHPLTPYGIAKNTLRELTQLLAKQYSADYQWLRGFYIVGNDENGNSIFSKIKAAASAGRSTFPFTTGQNQFDFLDYEMFCQYTSITVMQNEINGIINICSGVPEKLGDRVERFIKENNYNIRLEYGAYPDRPYDSRAIWGERKKLDTILSLDTEVKNESNNDN